jgi:hypothetical protein
VLASNMHGINDTSIHAESCKSSDRGDDGYNDDEDEQGNDATTTETEQVDRRDEVDEVRKMSSKDTNRLRMWRLVVTGVLLLTAFAVTFTTYTLLKQQEDENFKTGVGHPSALNSATTGHCSHFKCLSLSWSLTNHFFINVLLHHNFGSSQFEQFARTVGDAAVDQQKRMRDAFIGLANHISSAAKDVNATWPLFRIPLYELHVAQVRLQSGVEYLHCQYVVEPKDAEEYLKFVTANYEYSVFEAHMIRYGNLDRFTPTGYVPNFKIFGPNGTIVDTMDRPIRSAMWQISPRK